MKRPGEPLDPAAESSLPADHRYRSQAVPGLEIEVREPSEWTEGRKVRVYYQGQELQLLARLKQAGIEP